MLFKKKKKDEEEIVNPFESMGEPVENNDDTKEETVDTGLINAVEFNEPIYKEVSNPAILTEESIQTVTDVPVVGVTNEVEELDDKEILNEVHPLALEESDTNSDVMDFKAMDVDDLIQDVVNDTYCSNCGSKVNNDNDVCHLCGAALK